MLANRTNNQFIADKLSSRGGVTCSSPSQMIMGGGASYGITNDSINADIAVGLGKARPSADGHYSHCDQQKGGAAGHDYDADSVGQTYGYTKAGAAFASELKGGYPPITVQPKTNMCGGKKKRRRKNKSRKSRRKSRRKSVKGGRRKSKRSRRKRKKTRRKSRRKSKSRKNRRRRTRRRMKGGRYQQYGSNVPNTPSYSSPYTAGSMPWATGPVGINRKMNC
jgi:hypothetical protein